MMKYRKKPVVIDAHQWFKNGDHPLDYNKPYHGLENGIIREFTPDERKLNGWEGDIVGYYRHPKIDGEKQCNICADSMHTHGYIDTLEGGHIVCPTDWVIQGVKGEFYPIKNEIFHLTYEEVTS